jgi:hypothetical protein
MVEFLPMPELEVFMVEYLPTPELEIFEIEYSLTPESGILRLNHHFFLNKNKYTCIDLNLFRRFIH